MAPAANTMAQQPESPEEITSANHKAVVQGNIPDHASKNSSIPSTPEWQPQTIPKEHLIEIPDDAEDKARTRRTYSSFGDHGTTASVNANGHMIKMSRFLGYGPSGFLTVDLPDTPEPYYVRRRMERFMELSEEANRGIRLEIQEGPDTCWELSTTAPCLEFVDDRWPRFTNYADSPGQKNGLHFSLQYFCNGSTVFQRYTWERKYMDNDSPQLPHFRFNSHILIRDLDFVEGSNRFNDREEGYRCETISSDTNFLILHDPASGFHWNAGQSNDPSQHLINGAKHQVAGLVVAPFAYGKPQAMLQDQDHFYTIVLSEDAKLLFQDCGILEITMTYKLESRLAGECWKDAATTPEDLKGMQVKNDEYQKIAYSRHQHLDFVVRRNLEHILSVCSIPISKSNEPRDSKDDSTDTSAESAPDSEMTIALTCGDISDHRITSSASFFAFKFLISILEYISDQSLPPRDYLPENQSCICSQDKSLCKPCSKVKVYLQHLQQRVFTTCVRHLLWTYSTMEPNDGTFAPHYWATGAYIPHWELNYYLTPRALTDTPFQVLKTEAIINLVMDIAPFDPKFHKRLATSLLPRLRTWAELLAHEDSRGKLAFSRPSKDGTKAFFLADHFWINETLESVMDLTAYIELVAETSSQLSGSFAEQPSSFQFEELLPYELKKTMVRRFITVNPDSKKRMLATARTSTETRFQFRSTDMALLYAMDSGFFAKLPEKQEIGARRRQSRAPIEEWKSTLESQSDYEENQILDWENPLQYVLALVMASRGQKINRMPTKRVVRMAKDILLNSSSPNGLLPGLLKKDGDPDIIQDERDRDDYWHATFETPYALWAYRHNICSALSTPDMDQPQPQSEDKKKASSPEIATETGHTIEGSRLVSFLRKEVPFSNLNNVIDQRGLVEISDDWLQEGPGFLEFGSKPKALNWDERLHQKDGRDEVRHHDNYNNPDHSTESLDARNESKLSLDFSEENLSYACDTIQVATQLYEENHNIHADAVERGVIIDISKESKGDEIKSSEMMTNGKIFQVLSQSRRVQDAKKRLIWLPRGDKMTALLCYLAAPELERDNMSAFIDRHASYDKFFYDSVAPFQNEWETELHLSYFSLLQHDPGLLIEGGTIPYLSYIKVEQPQNEGKGRKKTRDGTPKTIVRATVSFRFVGDFYDRYWTCHVLDFNPNCHGCKPHCHDCDSSNHNFDPKSHDYSKNCHSCLKSLESLACKPGVASVKQPQDGYKEKHPWQQRKVLELLLFDEILGRIKLSTEEILDWVRGELSDVPQEGDSFLSEYCRERRQSLEKKRYCGTSLTSGDGYLRFDRANVSGAPFQLSSTYPLNRLAEALQGDIESKELKRSDSYFSRAKLWRFFETILQTLEDDLEENLERIEEWSRREEDRGLQKPRWTRNDERRYGSMIRTLQFQTRGKIHDLQRLKTSIKAFREPRSSKLSSIRDDISFRSSENINLFTYATVVFLPLGFATGLFSMNTAPESTTLKGMVVTAIVTVSVTLVALFNAKSLMDIFDHLIDWIRRKDWVDLLLFPLDLLFEIQWGYRRWKHKREVKQEGNTQRSDEGAESRGQGGQHEDLPADRTDNEDEAKRMTDRNPRTTNQQQSPPADLERGIVGS